MGDQESRIPGPRNISMKIGIVSDGKFGDRACEIINVEASAELHGTRLSPEQLRHYGLRICHFCRAPRFGRTCDKELSGLHHIRELMRSINNESPAAGARVRQFAGDMEKIIDQKITGG